MKFTLFAFSVLLLSACAAAPANDPWHGMWRGPEGTYLNISKNDGGTYDLIIQSLDTKETYTGALLGNHIEFMRHGQIAMIKHGTGKDTGMKWLLDKSDCVVIKAGEGFCR